MMDSIPTEHKEEIKNPLSKSESISYLPRLSSSLPEIHSPLPTIREYFSNEHSYYKAKVKKEFLAPTKNSDLLSKDEKSVDLPKYLDLIFLEGDNKGKMKYMNKTFFVLYENGKLQRRPGKEIIEDYSEIKKESHDRINWYLESLR